MAQTLLPTLLERLRLYQTSIEASQKTETPSTAALDAPVSADEIALAVSFIFTGELNPADTASLLSLLYATRLDHDAAVIAKCAAEMRAGANQPDLTTLAALVRDPPSSPTAAQPKCLGSYTGGFCDIVGTGGDGHHTFNISTAASIVVASYLRVAKHGNRASTSRSGSADLLMNIKLHDPSSDPSNHSILTPSLTAVTPANLLTIYNASNYAFLYAPVYHPGMAHAAAARKSLPHPTLFNLLGPLATPLDSLIEARMIGVKNRALGPIFAEVLRLNGTRKAMVVCGDENLDELSCAGISHCWRLVDDPDHVPAGTTNGDSTAPTSHPQRIEYFTLHPSDFDIPTHPLDAVAPGQSPEQNAATLLALLSPASAGHIEAPVSAETLTAITDFVVLNAAALLVVAGLCDDAQLGRESDNASNGSTSPAILDRGPNGGRWKEGARLARLAITQGGAMQALLAFAKVTSGLA